MDRNRTVHPGTFEKGWPVFAERIGRRALRIPLQQILGCQEFMGLSFQVNDQVLIPRQDTETLVEEILKDCQNRDVEILGSVPGSGCIGLSLAVLGRYRSVSAADISEVSENGSEERQKSFYDTEECYPLPVEKSV